MRKWYYSPLFYVSLACIGAAFAVSSGALAVLGGHSVLAGLLAAGGGAPIGVALTLAEGRNSKEG